MYKKKSKTVLNPEETLRKITEEIPLDKRMTTAEEIAGMAVFLIIPKVRSYGRTINVRAGMFIQIAYSVNLKRIR